MKKKIVAFGASSSKNSINKEFSYFAAKQIDNVVINLMDLNDFEMPIFRTVALPVANERAALLTSDRRGPRRRRASRAASRDSYNQKLLCVDVG